MADAIFPGDDPDSNRWTGVTNYFS